MEEGTGSWTYGLGVSHCVCKTEMPNLERVAPPRGWRGVWVHFFRSGFGR